MTSVLFYHLLNFEPPKLNSYSQSIHVEQLLFHIYCQKSSSPSCIMIYFNRAKDCLDENKHFKLEEDAVFSAICISNLSNKYNKTEEVF